VFDGVHLGHQHLVSQMLRQARAVGQLCGVITLHPHPRQVLGNGSFVPAYLTTLEERVSRLRQIGIDWVATLRFSDPIGHTPAAEFMAEIRECIHYTELWAGPDFALGRGREGNLARLREIGDQLGFAVHIASPLLIGNQPASSTRIRKMLQEGDLQTAATLLGRPFTISGEVVAGFQRGREIGFPTANIEPEEGLLIPANGVYAAYATWVGRKHPALVNIGNRPTFDDGPRSIEAYILDVSEDLYGQQMGLEIRQRIRGEKRFPGPAELVAQINDDIRQARNILVD
jgi:riboflavin kinase / FMN adenylyltransferase